MKKINKEKILNYLKNIIKELNKKRVYNYCGFTLIELLAVIIILGVLLLVSVPAVGKYIEKSRKETYINSVKSIVEQISISFNKLEYPIPNKYEAIIVPFSEVNLEKGSATKSPFAKYVENKNYVVIKFDGQEYKYYVTTLDEKGYSIPLVDVKELSSSSITTDSKKINRNVYSLDEIRNSSESPLGAESLAFQFKSEKNDIIKIKTGITPQMYGAKGDGKTDDTNAMKLFFNSGNKFLYIPNGTYNINIKPYETFVSYKDTSNVSIISEDGALIKNTNTDKKSDTAFIGLEDCKNFKIKLKYEGKYDTLDSFRASYTYDDDEEREDGKVGGSVVVIKNTSENSSDNIEVELDAKYIRYGVLAGQYRYKHNNINNIKVTGKSYLLGYFIAAYGVEGLEVDCETIYVKRGVYLSGCKDVNVKNTYLHSFNDINIAIGNDWLKGEMMGLVDAEIECYEYTGTEYNDDFPANEIEAATVGSTSVGMTTTSYRFGGTNSSGGNNYQSTDGILTKDTTVEYKNIDVYVEKSNKCGAMMSIYNNVVDTLGYTLDDGSFKKVTLDDIHKDITLRFVDNRSVCDRTNESGDLFSNDIFKTTGNAQKLPVVMKEDEYITIEDSKGNGSVTIHDSVNLKIINSNLVITRKDTDSEPGPGKLDLKESFVITRDTENMANINLDDNSTYFQALPSTKTNYNQMNTKSLTYYTVLYWDWDEKLVLGDTLKYASSYTKKSNLTVDGKNPTKIYCWITQSEFNGKTLEVYNYKQKENSSEYVKSTIVSKKINVKEPIMIEIDNWSDIENLRFAIKQDQNNFAGLPSTAGGKTRMYLNFKYDK